MNKPARTIKGTPRRFNRIARTRRGVKVYLRTKYINN